MTIEWFSVPDDWLIVEISVDDGVEWHSVAMSAYEYGTISSGHYRLEFVIPSTPEYVSDQCRIRVKDQTGDPFYGISDRFTIAEGAGGVRTAHGLDAAGAFVTAREFYTLQGRRLGVASRDLRRQHGALLVRQTQADGRQVVRKMAWEPGHEGHLPNR